VESALTYSLGQGSYFYTPRKISELVSQDNGDNIAISPQEPMNLDANRSALPRRISVERKLQEPIVATKYVALTVIEKLYSE
jgi:hypothetical protein